MAVMMHLVLRQLAIWRPLALALPIVFALLPHYSADRYWFAAFGYVLSMALFFLSLYADLRGADSVSNTLKWKLLALTALMASALNYEVAIPLFLLSTPLIALRYRALPPGSRGRVGVATSTMARPGQRHHPRRGRDLQGGRDRRGAGDA